MAEFDFSGLNQVLGLDRAPPFDFSLDVEVPVVEMLRIRMRLAEVSNLNRIATALEELVRQGQQQRIDARRTRSKKGIV